MLWIMHQLPSLDENLLAGLFMSFVTRLVICFGAVFIFDKLFDYFDFNIILISTVKILKWLYSV